MFGKANTRPTVPALAGTDHGQVARTGVPGVPPPGRGSEGTGSRAGGRTGAQSPRRDTQRGVPRGREPLTATAAPGQPCLLSEDELQSSIANFCH